MKENLLLHIYYLDRYKEVDLTRFSETLITIGGSRSDKVYLEGARLSEKQVVLNRETDGFYFDALESSVYQNGGRIHRKKLIAGEVFILEANGSKIALMIKNKFEFPEPTLGYQLEKNPVSFGQKDDNKIIIHDRLVSGHHAVLNYINEQYVIQDQSSTNGVFVNGMKVQDKQLVDGDCFTLCGHTFILKQNVIYTPLTEGIVLVKDLKPLKRSKPTYPYLQRPPRIMTPMPSGEMIIQSPPQGIMKPNVNWLLVLLPSLGMMLVPIIFIMASINSGTPPSATAWIYIPTTIISLTTSILTYSSQIAKFKKEDANRTSNYEKYLEQKQLELTKIQDQQVNSLLKNNPNFNECLNAVEKRAHHLWDRLPNHPDFLSICLGKGNSSFAYHVKMSDTNQVFGEEEILLKKAKELVSKFQVVQGIPVNINLLDQISIGITGDREAILNFTRNLTIFLTTTHAYDELKIGVVCPTEEYREWSWMRWLPHIWDDSNQQRFFAKDRRGAQSLFTSLLEVIKSRDLTYQGIDTVTKQNPLPVYVLLISDSEMVKNEPLLRYLVQNKRELGIVTLFLFNQYENLPKDCNCIIHMTGQKGNLIFKDGSKQQLTFEPEDIHVLDAEKFSRALAPVRLQNLTTTHILPKKITLFELFRIKKTSELNLMKRWKQSEPYISLAADIGIGQDGRNFQLDLHEKAHGPHGLVAGTTGSGKSEFLQTMILSLAINYHPHELSFILIDYKGGGMANLFKKIPHVSGIITNLGGNQTNRALASLRGEVAKRQALFDQAGVNHIDKYQKMIRNNEMKVKMPHLIIIIDEFAELKAEKPEFISELVSTARVGRSYGIHLILATQKPSGVVDGQIWSNARFKVCLKVQNTEDSREMLKRPDAAAITIPGRAYLQVGNDEVFELFQSAWSGAEFHDLQTQEVDTIKEVELDGTRIPLDRNIFRNDKKSQITELTEIVDWIASETVSYRVQPIPGPWLPPLPDQLYLDAILMEYIEGLKHENDGIQKGWSTACIGVADHPSAQAQFPVVLNFANEGHVVILGAPSSGKTTMLKTLILSLAMTSSPEDAWFYILDFGGRTMNVFEEMPHTGAVIKPEEEDKIKNFSKMMINEMEQRKRIFAELGAASIVAYRSNERKIPAIYVVIDNFAGLMEAYPEFEEQLIQIAREGGSLGIFLVISAQSANIVKYKIMSNIKRVLALQLTDHNEYSSLFGRGSIEPMNLPGRGLLKADQPLEFQVALPVHGENEIAQSMEMKIICKKMSVNWTGKRAKKVPVVPSVLTRKELYELSQETTCIGVPIGVALEEVKPIFQEFESVSSFLVTGQAKGMVFGFIKEYTQILMEQASTKSYEVISLMLVQKR